MGNATAKRFGAAHLPPAIPTDGDSTLADTVPALDKPPVLSGGPGIGSDAPAVQFTAIKYKDKTFNTQDELTSYLDDLDTRIKAAKPVAVTVTAPVIPQPTPQAAPVLQTGEKAEDRLAAFFADPIGYEKRLKEELRADMDARTSAQNNMTTFWNDFWTENKELDRVKHNSFVTGVMESIKPEIGPMTLVDARKRLSEAVQDAVLSVGGKARSQDKSGKAIVEGAGSSAPKPAAKTENASEKPGSLSASIRARAKARRDAAEKGRVGQVH